MDQLRERRVSAQVSGHDLIDGPEAGGLHEVRVVGRVVGDAERGPMLKARHQKPRTVQRAEALGALDPREASGARPVERRLEQRPGRIRLIEALEQVEERRPLLVELVEGDVVKNREPAHGAGGVIQGKKECGSGSTVERMTSPVKHEPGVGRKRWNPLRCVPVYREGHIQEAPHVPGILRVNGDNVHQE